MTKYQIEKKFIPLTRPYFDSEELRGLQEVLDSGWVTQGAQSKRV